MGLGLRVWQRATVPGKSWILANHRDRIDDYIMADACFSLQHFMVTARV
jgi:hypothetical protein